jgi:hypothetical protein
MQKKQQPKLSSAHLQDIVRRHYNGEHINALAREFGVTPRAIRHRMERAGMPTIKRTNSPYQLNHSFFDEITTEAKSYVLGFVHGDGCVMHDRNSRGKRLAISLSERDADHLERIRAVLGSTRPLSRHTQGRNSFSRGKTYVSLAIGSMQLVTGLEKHGIHPNKTHTVLWPDFLNDALARHYLRGLFDADGSWSFNGNHAVWNLCGNQPALTGCREWLHRQHGFGLVKLRAHHNGAVYHLRYDGRFQARRMYRLLYDDCTLWLPRKKEKARQGLSALFNHSLP